MSDDESMDWSEEEVRYIQALLTWDPNEDARGRDEPIRQEDPPVGHFMFLVLGDKGCGKTSMVERFCQDTFHEYDDGEFPDSQYEQGCCHNIKIEEHIYILNAFEVASEHLTNYQQLEQAFQVTEAAVLVYSVRSRASFDIIQGIHDLICDTVGGRGYSLILVGTNSDCEDEQREVPWAEGYKLAHSFRLRCAFIETSAKTGENIHRLFPQLGKEVLELRWVTQQRKEEAEKVAATSSHCPEKRMAKWKSWTRSWAQLKLIGRKASASTVSPSISFLHS
ncbi:P-loop containing nucleoside triphosphate hydrolase protein [Whalleya microplaca]|nr:P-loop containing nucleoside triphosphate hydrolase protein [Whalleya microplaca]